MSDRFRLDGRAALVTGASGGLGRHFALVLAKAGALVAIGARRADKLAETKSMIEDAGGKVQTMAMDVTDPASVTAAFAVAEEALGPISILINNAGLTRPALGLKMDEADWNMVIDTNLNGVWRVAQEAARRMVEAKIGGTIINLASIIGQRQMTGQASYAAAKAGVIQITKTLAMELARHNIRVNALAPGFIETDMNRDYFATDAGQRMIASIPQRRHGRLDDLDGPLLLLASEASAYMTGAVVTIDGGHMVNSL